MENNILNKEEIITLYKASVYNTHNLSKILKLNYLDTYNFIDSNFSYSKPNNKKNKFSEKIYRYVYNNNGMCKQCNAKPTTFRSLSEGYLDFCSQTCQQLNTAAKYGVTNLFQSEEIKNKTRQTWIKNYGVDNPNKSDTIKRKSKVSKLEKYGDANYNNTEKNKQTCLEKYGVSSPNKLESVKLKVKNTHIQRYGGLGYESKIIRKKIDDTNILRYGSKTPMHNEKLFEKQKIACYQLKNYTLPSGKIIKIQGYEHFALNHLLKIYNEEDIITDRKYIPKFSYELNGKIKKYFPDIFIKSTNTIVEVKSEWTNILHIITDDCKRKCVINSGVNFQKLVFNKKGEITNV